MKNDGISIIADDDKNLSYPDQTITFFVLGNMIPDEKIKEWNDHLSDFNNLKNTIHVKQWKVKRIKDTKYDGV